MNLESYFATIAPDDIRVKGTRIGIERILYEYVHRSQPPEAIAERYASVSLEQVYATILWCLRDRTQLEVYLADWLAASRAARAAQERSLPPVVQKLRQIKAAQQLAQ